MWPHCVGPRRIVAVSCIVNVPFRNNRRFRLISSTGHGSFDFNTGLLTYTQHQQSKLYYYTQIGPCVSTPTSVYANTVYNMSKALYRQFNSRVSPHTQQPSELYDRFLHMQQTRNLPQHNHRITEYRSQLSITHRYKGQILEELEHYADAHPKRAARIRALIDLYRSGRHSVWHRLRGARGYVNMQLKMEFAKIGKVGRTVGDLGVEASLLGAWFIKYLKDKMSQNPYVAQDIQLEAWFCPDASYRSLHKAFTKLHTPQHTYTLILFSDDAALAVTHNGHTQYFDIDISSCDKSHGRALFQQARIIAGDMYPTDMEVLLEQLRAPCRVRNPSRPTEKSTYQPVCETLYSGSTLTTFINNIAVINIGIAIATQHANTTQQMQTAAESIGYIITVEERMRFEHVQFLKYSPARDISGNWQPLLNLGVYMRAQGMCLRELPGRKTTPLRERARQQSAAIAQCSFAHTHFPLIDTHRAILGAPPSDARVRFAQLSPFRAQYVSTWPELHFTDQSVMERYFDPGHTPPDVQAFFTADVYTICGGPGISEILRRDYGLTDNDAVGGPAPPELLTDGSRV